MFEKNFKKLFQNYFSISPEHISHSLRPFAVSFLVTILTKSNEVIEVQGDLRTMDVRRRQLLDVVNFLCRFVDPTSQAILTQIVSTLHVFIPARLPRCRTIKLFRKLSCHNYHQRKRPSVCPVLAVNPCVYSSLKGVHEKPTMIRARVELTLSPSNHNADQFKSAGGDLVAGCLPTFDTIII